MFNESIAKHTLLTQREQAIIQLINSVVSAQDYKAYWSQQLEKLNHVAKADRDTLYYVQRWGVLNKLAIRASMVGGSSNRAHADKLFNLAREALQMVQRPGDHAFVRALSAYCHAEADRCNNRCENNVEIIMREFALAFATMTPDDEFSVKQTRIVANCYYQLAFALSRQAEADISYERLDMNIRNAVHKLGELPYKAMRADDFRLLSTYYILHAEVHHRQGEHDFANKCYEQAIRAIINIDAAERTASDSSTLAFLRKNAKSEDTEAIGMMGALRHYGLLAKSSKTEDAFEPPSCFSVR